MSIIKAILYNALFELKLSSIKISIQYNLSKFSLIGFNKIWYKSLSYFLYHIQNHTIFYFATLFRKMKYKIISVFSHLI